MAAKPTIAEQLIPSVRVSIASQDPSPLPSANKREEVNCTPSEHWSLFWKQAFQEHPWLFNSSSPEGKLSNSHVRTCIVTCAANSGTNEEEYFKEGDADARHDIFVPILPIDEPFGPLVDIQALDQGLEPGPSTPVPPISPVVPSTPHFRSSPSLILTDWTPTPPSRLRTRSDNRDDETRSPDGAVLGNGSVEPEGMAEGSTPSVESSSRFLEEGNTTTSSTRRIEHSSASNRPPLETDGVNDQPFVPSSSQTSLGRQRPLGAGLLRHLQLSPRRTQKHRGELRTEYTAPMHLTKQNSIPKSFSPSQPLFSQPQATLTQELVPASVDETSQEITSSDSFRIPPGQMAVMQESQQSRLTLECTSPESPIDVFVEGFSWEITASESIRFPPSGQIAATQGSQATGPVSQDTGEAKTSFKTPDPLAKRDHRWKSKNINPMLSSSPIYPTPSALNSPTAETSVGPMDSTSQLSDSDIAYHQYMEDHRTAKEKVGSPASSEDETGSQLEMDELRYDVSSKAPSTEGSGESHEETDNKKEGPNRQSIIVVEEAEHTQHLPGDVDVQWAPEEQGGRLTPGPEAPPAQSEKRVEEVVQPDEGGEPQEPPCIGPPETEEGDDQKRVHERLARTPIQELRANIPCELQIKEVKATQRGAEEARAEAHKETGPDDARGEENEAKDYGRKGIAWVLPSAVHETGLTVESTTQFETANEGLQDVGSQHKSLRTHLQSPLMVITPTSLHGSEPQVSKARPRAPRRLPWHLAESDGRSPSASITPPPPPQKQGQVLGKRKRISVGDNVREQARTPPPPSIFKIPVEKANFPGVLLQPLFQHHSVIKRRKAEYIDTPLEIDFEESGSDSDEIPIDNWRPKRGRVEKAPTIQVQDGSPFSRNKPSRPPSFDVPSPRPSVISRGPSIPGAGKVQLSRPSLRAHQPALSLVPSSSVRDQQPMVLSVHRSRRVSAQSSTVQQRPTYPVSSRASPRYPSPVSSLFREDRSFSHRPSTVPRHSPSYIDQSDFSDFRDDVSVLSTDTLPHVDDLKRKSVHRRTSSSTWCLQR